MINYGCLLIFLERCSVSAFAPRGKLLCIFDQQADQVVFTFQHCLGFLVAKEHGKDLAVGKGGSRLICHPNLTLPSLAIRRS